MVSGLWLVRKTTTNHEPRTTNYQPPTGMDPSEFRRSGHALVEWIADYLSHSEQYPVLPRVAPGDVRDALPDRAPEESEAFEDIFADFERILVPALTHWNHPGFFAYFPA